MTFKEYYVREAQDKVNEAESQLHITDDSDAIIAAAKKIVRAQAELSRRKNVIKHFVDEHEYLLRFEQLYTYAINQVTKVAREHIEAEPCFDTLLSACEIARKARRNFNAAHTLVDDWKAYNKR
jgi:hypothetical protein